MKIGYARVSTQEQDLALQLDALTKEGCEKIFQEKASGAQRDRPELKAALSYMRRGDTLVVWKLDRLARSMKQLIETIESFQDRGIGLEPDELENIYDPFYRSRYGYYDPFYRSRFGSRYDPFYDPFYGGYTGRPYWSRYGGYYGGRSPFYYGWDDPFWYSSPYAGYGPGYRDPIRSYTVYKSYLDLDIVRKGDNAPLFQGKAKARSQTDEAGVLIPNLIEAMFTNFPGKSGETIKITVPARKGS